MTRRRWIADEVSGNRAFLVGGHADHLVRVLRARVGQEFDVITPAGVRRGQITSLTESSVEFELGQEVSSKATIEITLALSIFKFDRMEWAIEKCTELGVSRIIPLNARRTDSHLGAASMKRMERWQRIVLQASEQSRRFVPPEILKVVKLPEILDLTAALRIVLNEAEERTLLRDVLTSAPQPNRAESPGEKTGIILAVGPEGGWTEDELRRFREAGWVSASLGETILRAETAAIAAAAIVTSALVSL
jgi:16S rRNA (uracil1498-N3)-methyltransferase